MVEPARSIVLRLIEFVGCDCESHKEKLEDHVCLAGMAELEWRAMNEENELLKKDLEDVGRCERCGAPQVYLYPQDEGPAACQRCHDKSICEIECPEEFQDGE